MQMVGACLMSCCPQWFESNAKDEDGIDSDDDNPHIHRDPILTGVTYEDMVESVTRHEREKQQKRFNDVQKQPEYWKSNLQYDQHAQYEISLESEISKTVLKRFHETVPETNAEVIKIEAIQNQRLYDSYLHAKDTLICSLGDESKLQTEILFHGAGSPNTGMDVMVANTNMESIARQGFRKEYSTKTVYGAGTYFAKHSDYVLRYAVPDIHGDTLKMFACYVLIGNYEEGMQKYSLTQWPLQPNGHLYDALVDDMQKPTIYVIHEDARAYPALVIHYKLKKRSRLLV
eukprot:42657_1